jgi:O-antigen/teichoic acid export membrane protein
MFVGSMLGNTLIAVAAQGAILRVALSGAVASIVLNLLLIPASGAIGGAIATLATESLVALALLGVVRKRIEVSLFSPALIRVTIGAVTMALCVVVLNAAPVGLRLAVAVAAYLAVCGRMLLRSVWVIRERAADE